MPQHPDEPVTKMRIAISLTDEEYDAVLLSLEHTLERSIAAQPGRSRDGGDSIGANEPLDVTEEEQSAAVWPSSASITSAIEKLVDARLEI